MKAFWYNVFQLSFEEFLSYEDKDGKYLNLTIDNAIAGIIVTKDFTSTSKLGRKKIFYVPAVLMSRFIYGLTRAT